MKNVEIYDGLMRCPQCDNEDKVEIYPDTEGYYNHICSKCFYDFKVTFNISTYIDDMLNKPKANSPYNILHNVIKPRLISPDKSSFVFRATSDDGHWYVLADFANQEDLYTTIELLKPYYYEKTDFDQCGECPVQEPRFSDNEEGKEQWYGLDICIVIYKKRIY